MNLRPAERAQITALLGALGSGLSGQTAYSIFGNIESQIADRKQQAQQRKMDLVRLQLQEQAQQSLMDERAASMQQAQEKLALGLQADHSSALGKLTSQLLGEALPTQSTTTTTTNGVPTTRTSGVAPADYSALMTQLGALAPSIPGGVSKQEYQGLAGSLDKALYNLPNVPDPFWNSVRDNAVKGVSQGVAPQEVLKKILAAAAAQGYDAPSEQQKIAELVSHTLQAQGFGAPAPTAPTAPDGGGVPLVGGLINAALGALGVAGAAKGAQLGLGALRSSMGIAGKNELAPGMQKSIDQYGGPPLTGSRAAVAGESPVAQVNTVMDSVQALAENPFYVRAGAHVPAALPAGSGPLALEPGTSPATNTMLGEGQPLENTMPGLRGGGFSGVAGDALGALGALGLPLAVLDATVGQSRRNDAEQARAAAWQSMSQPQKQAAFQAAVASGEMDPAKDGFDWSTGLVLKGGRGARISQQTGQIEQVG